MKDRLISNVHDCISALGGPREAARFMRVGQSQISNMLRDGHITSGHHLRVFFRLTEEGYSVDPVGVFGVQIDGRIACSRDERPTADAPHL